MPVSEDQPDAPDPESKYTIVTLLVISVSAVIPGYRDQNRYAFIICVILCHLYRILKNL